MFLASVGGRLLGGSKSDDKKDSKKKKDDEDAADEEEAKAEGKKGGDEGDEEAEDELTPPPEKVIPLDQFFARVEKIQEGWKRRGASDQEAQHWSYPRRWQVKIWDMRIENLTQGPQDLFCDFTFGGYSEGLIVADNKKERVYVAANPESLRKQCFVRTSVQEGIAPEETRDFDLQEIFEYRASYLDLELEKVVVQVWQWYRRALNKLVGTLEKSLVNFAQGTVYFDETIKQKVKRVGMVDVCRVSFQLYFQEIYDFELLFNNWSIEKIMHPNKAQWMLQRTIDEKTGGGGHIGVRWIVSEINRQLDNLADMEMLPFGNLRRASVVEERVRPYERGSQDLEMGEDEQQEKSSSKASSEVNSSDVGERELPHFIPTTNTLEAEELCNPRLYLEIPSREGVMYRSPMNKLACTSPMQKRTNNPSWDSIGVLYFRGTAADLENSALNVRAVDERTKRLIGSAFMPLKGVLESGYVRRQLNAPLALANRADSEGIDVQILHQPRYRQVGDVLEIIPGAFYLIVRVIEIDHLYTRDDRDQIDSCVQVTFDGTSRHTRPIRGSLKPEYQDELAFAIRLSPYKIREGESKGEERVAMSDVKAKGPIAFDVWGFANDIEGSDHLGGVEVPLWEILSDKDGKPFPAKEKKCLNVVSGKEEAYKAYVWSGRKDLTLTWTREKQPRLKLQIWTKPSLIDLLDAPLPRTEAAHSSTDGLPKAIAKNFTKHKANFDAKTSAHRINDRFFPSMAIDQRQREHFLPTYLTAVTPPKDLDNENVIAYFIQNIPFSAARPLDTVETDGDATGRRRKRKRLVITSPDFFLMTKVGPPIDHCILHCSILLGYPTPAYVCIGTLWNRRPHAWVMTWHSERLTVKFWETTPFTTYNQPHRFYDTERAKKLIEQIEARQPSALDKFVHRRRDKAVKLDEESSLFPVTSGDGETDGDSTQRSFEEHDPLPYRSIDVVFDTTNVWANLQHHSPAKIYYDLWNDELWYPFHRTKEPLRPFYSPKSLTAAKDPNKDERRLRQMEDIHDRLQYEIATHRTSLSLSTKFHRDDKLEAFLHKGLMIYEQLEIRESYQDLQYARAQLNDWKSVMHTKTPENHRLLMSFFHFNTVKSTTIAQRVTEQTPFLATVRDRGARFAIGVLKTSLPEGMSSVFVVVACVSPVTQEERDRELLEKREQEEEQRRRQKMEETQTRMLEQKAAETEKESVSESETPAAIANGQIESEEEEKGGDGIQEEGEPIEAGGEDENAGDEEASYAGEEQEGHGDHEITREEPPTHRAPRADIAAATDWQKQEDDELAITTGVTTEYKTKRRRSRERDQVDDDHRRSTIGSTRLRPPPPPQDENVAIDRPAFRQSMLMFINVAKKTGDDMHEIIASTRRESAMMPDQRWHWDSEDEPHVVDRKRREEAWQQAFHRFSVIAQGGADPLEHQDMGPPGQPEDTSDDADDEQEEDRPASAAPSVTDLQPVTPRDAHRRTRPSFSLPREDQDEEQPTSASARRFEDIRFGDDDVEDDSDEPVTSHHVPMQAHRPQRAVSFKDDAYLSEEGSLSSTSMRRSSGGSPKGILKLPSVTVNRKA
ncbi:unnamed protein product [Vitrella brassicaformis CCMP3155]|uniref:C2 domain-containing protein n=1 Tax=Vitrella brassicaformis (strain CCMP3155) TaxID=1169540 RepID=A0A0G4ES88_VITBC|nr:unnamed protein product [Vitrella brassicaformis CCMP3155]|eukprot:CEM00725.1 unnamed protein product [Vitrella brassicaformis CCMP3155]